MATKLKHEHPLAQSKWHGVGLNLRKKLSPARINELSHALIKKHKKVASRHDYAVEHHKQLLANPMHPGNLFSNPFQREEEIKKLDSRVSRLRDFNTGLHHKPIRGDHDEWESGKK